MSKKAKHFSEEAFAKVFRLSPDPMSIKTFEEGRFVDVNDSWLLTSGYSHDEVIGRTVIDLGLRTSEERKEFLQLLRNQGYVHTRKVKWRVKSGVTRIWLSSSALIDIDGQTRVLTTNSDITELERLRKNMQSYISNVTRAQEDERKRIARDLHDDIIQSLISLCLDLERTKKNQYLTEETSHQLDEIYHKIDSITKRVRNFCYELRPDLLDRLGLLPALRAMVKEVNDKKFVDIRLEKTGTQRRLSPEAELVLFRIIQECLNNIQRHSLATKGSIRVAFLTDKVNITVADNGKGFNVPNELSDLAYEGKLGLLGIQERIRLLDGSLLVQSEQGKHTTIIIEVIA